MLQRRTAHNGVMHSASHLLARTGVPHAFRTRVGGLSPAPFDSLNLGNPNGCDVQDDYAHIWENYRLLQQAAGCAGRELCRVHQVHGSAVARVVRGQLFDNSIKADALIGDDPSRVLSVRVADCVSVRLATDDGRRGAAVHAGWRGVVGGVVPSSVGEMCRKGASNPTTLIAAIGPCIGRDGFEVGPEALTAF